MFDSNGAIIRSAEVEATEKELKFATRTEAIEIKANLELERMLDSQGMDM